MSAPRSKSKTAARPASAEFVTVLIGGQLFGIPIAQVQDVFSPQSLTRVPLAPPEVAGVLNLRGRIVTAIDVRARLGVKPRGTHEPAMAVGIDHKGEAYGLIIDSVGEVLSLDPERFEANPANLDPRWRQVSNGIFRLENELLVILNVERLLEFGRLAA